MLKFLWIILGLACFAALAYRLHVPVLKYWTAPARNSELTGYATLSGKIEGQTYEIEQIVNGHTMEIFYDPENRIYIIVAEFFEYDRDDYFGRHIVLLEENGALRDIRRIDQAHLDILFAASNLETVNRIGAPATEHRFFNSGGAIDLVHYQFLDFVDWPYLYYFIPIIPSDWHGMAYLKISHQTDVFNIKIPTNYLGGFLYSAGTVDGQIYLRQRPDVAAELTFLQVDEGSYTRDMNGHETHREGYGLYLIRRK